MTTRRLAAILAADVVGFSSMMEKDEEGTLTRVKALQREVIQGRQRRWQKSVATPISAALRRVRCHPIASGYTDYSHSPGHRPV